MKPDCTKRGVRPSSRASSVGDVHLEPDDARWVARVGLHERRAALGVAAVAQLRLLRGDTEDSSTMASPITRTERGRASLPEDTADR